MNTDYSFWAIVDEEDAVVSVLHAKYGEVKAIFPTAELARKALEIQDDSSGLRVEGCEVHGK